MNNTNENNSYHSINQNTKISSKKKNMFMKKLFQKIKENFENEEIKNEIKNEIINPLYKQIKITILPYYSIFIIILLVILIMLSTILIMIINTNKKYN